MTPQENQSRQISTSEDSSTDQTHGKPYRNKHHGLIRHHLRRRSRKGERRPRDRRLPRHQRQHNPLHEDGHQDENPQEAPTYHAGYEVAESWVVFNCGWGVEERS